MATQPQKADQAAPRKRGKLILIVAVLLVMAGGGAGTWYFLRPVDPHAKVAERPAVFLPLESFTVNLVGGEAQPQYLQAGLTLKLYEAGQGELIKDRMPEVRNRILMVLSGKKVNELLPVIGKQKLAVEIADAVKDVIAPGSTAKPRAQAAPAPKVAAAGEAHAATVAAEGAGAEQPAAEVAPPPAPKPAPKLEVLFTSFIVQ